MGNVTGRKTQDVFEEKLTSFCRSRLIAVNMSFRLRKGASVIAFAIAVRFQTRKLCEKLYMRVKGCSVGKTSKTLSLGPYYADVAQRVNSRHAVPAFLASV